MFDVVEFYPSITPQLMKAALDFAAAYVNITSEEWQIIEHAKDSILVGNKEIWKKKSNQLFDVTMGSHDRAETCELIGLYLLNQIKDLNGNFGLYRDDGLGVIKATPKQIENAKKQLCKPRDRAG